MESSEDDAGAATNASRRVSAREKDVGQIEDVNATSSFHQDPSESRTFCQTPAMSEDNFDGDSVPSPSTQDVNTSTEAILDMIDEIVDGPGAPKRLPLTVANDTDSRFAGGGDHFIETNDEKCYDPPIPPTNLASAKSEQNQSDESSLLNVQTPHSNVTELQKPLKSSVDSKTSQNDIPILLQQSECDVVAPVLSAQTEESAEQQISQSNVIADQTIPRSEVCTATKKSQSEVCAQSHLLVEVETSRSLVCTAIQAQSQSQDHAPSIATMEVDTCKSDDCSVTQTSQSVSSKSEDCSVTQTSQSVSSKSEDCSLTQTSQSVSSKSEDSSVAQSCKSEDDTVAQTSKTEDCSIAQTSQSESSNSEDCSIAQTSQSEPPKSEDCSLVQTSESEPSKCGDYSVAQTYQSDKNEDCHVMQTLLSEPSKSEDCFIEPTSKSKDFSEAQSSQRESCKSEDSSIVQTSECEPSKCDDYSVAQTYQSKASTNEDYHVVQTLQNESLKSEDCPVVQTSESEVCAIVSTLQSKSCTAVQMSENDVVSGIDISQNEVCGSVQMSQSNDCSIAHSSQSTAAIGLETPQSDVCIVVPTSQNELNTPVQISQNKFSEVVQTLQHEVSGNVHTSQSEVNEEVQTSQREISEEEQINQSEISEEVQTSQSEVSEEIQTSQSEVSEKVQTSQGEVNVEEQTSQRKISEEVQINQSEVSEEVQTSQSEVSEEVQTSQSEVSEKVHTSQSEVSEEVQTSQEEVSDEVQPSQTEVREIMQPSQSEVNLSQELKSVSTDIEKSTVSCSKDPSDSPLVDIPTSSVVQTVQSVLQTKSSLCERTLKRVTSSDNRDNVTVESAESTSSDNSISEVSRVCTVENVTRSPLRRRLVRPAPIRPDSTVSSTVDSSIKMYTSEQASDCIIKDVSSSSDAVPFVHKPEEIRNISEVSICKAETSSSPKRIKLIRQKCLPQTGHIQPEVQIHAQQKPMENEQCQSTSSEIQTAATKTTIEIIKINKEVSSNDPQNDVKLPVQSDTTAPLKIESSISTKQSDLPEDKTVSEGIKEISVIKEKVSEVCASPDKMNTQMEDAVDVQKKLPLLKINLSTSNKGESVEAALSKEKESSDSSCSNIIVEDSESVKQVPKLTIKLSSKHSEEMKSPVPRLTIKPIKPPSEEQIEIEEKVKEQIPHITKINIKPITKQPEKINEIHRKSSSSEISESEYSENDESTSTSDQASASDQGMSDIVPKVTIKLGKPGTESEGQFYTERNVPKLTIKAIQNSEHEEPLSPSKLKVFISQSENIQTDKVPKLTIKTVTKCETQPLSPKLTIKPIKHPGDTDKEIAVDHTHPQEIPKLKLSTETLCSNAAKKNFVHTVSKSSDTACSKSSKMVTKFENESTSKSKKAAPYENSENIPVVTKLNIKPLTKPSDSTDISESLDDKVPVVSKLNIKPIVKSKDNEIDYNKEDIPKITKLNIKPIKSPETNSSEEKDCDDLKAAVDENSMPVITKLNIKPIVMPLDEDTSKDNENQSSETGNSSDDNTDHIPFVTKINIKPICKPNDKEESGPSVKKEDNIPVITKLNIKPLVKPEEYPAPLSPKKEILKGSVNIPTITKLNIKPIIKPEEIKHKETSSDDVKETPTKKPPLVMKINRKTVESYVNDNQYNVDKKSEHEHCNNINIEPIPVISKISIKPIVKPVCSEISDKAALSEPVLNCATNTDELQKQEVDELKTDEKILEQAEIKQNCITKTEINLFVNKDKKVLETKEIISESPKNPDPISQEKHLTDLASHSPMKETKGILEKEECKKNVCNALIENLSSTDSNDTSKIQADRHTRSKTLPARQNCMLLKKLLETRKDKIQEEIPNQTNISKITSKHTNVISQSPKNIIVKNDLLKEKNYSEPKQDLAESSKKNDISIGMLKVRSMQELCKEVNENVTKPLEINVSDKVSQQSSDQDSPRIILKINKTDQGASAKIITEELKKSEQPASTENTHHLDNDIQQKKNILNRKKTHIDTPMPMGKRLRSSRILQSSEMSPLLRRNMVKRPFTNDSSPPKNKSEPELSVLETKRLKLGQLLSNKSLTITPIVAKTSPISPPPKPTEIKQGTKNHSILNNENCAKNGSSKLHDILSSLQAKQMQAMPFTDRNHTENNQSLSPELKSSTSTASPELVTENLLIEKSTPDVQIIFNDNSESRDFNIASEEMAQDPLQVDNLRPNDFLHENIPKIVEITPQPKKRGRPRKLPVSEGARPVVTLPTPALEERPQRSLRLSRDRPVILVKPRGRGRGRGRRIETEPNPTPVPEPVVETATKFFVEQKPEEEIDPTSSRIKLPRMTEALDKMPSVCSTPLSSRRRTSSTDLPLFGSPEPKVVLEQTPLPKMEDPFLKSPVIVGEMRGRGWRGGRGSRGGRGRAPGRSPRGRGRGRGGGRGAMYMKETMGIYGRVCGPATTTVQLFEEETCMMDDNATPAKPTHLLDEDSQSSVKSSTNDSSKMKKSKFADLFDSNKVWTAADVKEYTWPPPSDTDGEKQVMMIQEQVAMFLGVKSFKRRYPELKRRTITGDERSFVLSKGLVTEALCDLGITAVDASEVLDIMLSDYPHKYEEFRSHQRQKQIEEPEEIKPEIKTDKVDVKEPKLEQKTDLPKVDPEKLRQEMAAAAIASASEWNQRLNATRRPACADLQSLTVQRRRAPAAPPRVRVQPPAGFYPHALLPGQYQHCYRVYTPEELRYFPLNTALAAPPAPPSPVESSSDSEPEWGFRCSSTDDSDTETHRNAKRKKITKTKRSSQTDASNMSAAVKEEEVDTCRVCKLRLEANRKYTHERFLVCARCSAKLHPSCVELSPDTIRKCREYPWQCADCKTCCGCSRPADDDKMLFCDLCDRGFHIYCVGLQTVPNGRWHCVECAICKSCGARDPSGAGGAAGGSEAPGSAGAAGALGSVSSEGAQWHHQTRRGPGGHKVYSHSLCTPCARAYRIGRYCPLCERSFIGPKGTMQLVICKLCDRQLHQECVKQTVSSLNVLDYTCGDCRRGGITSRAAAVRLAPRTIATLFMAKRRFNKYAHRQYLQSRLQERDDPEPADDASDPLDGIGDPPCDP